MTPSESHSKVQGSVVRTKTIHPRGLTADQLVELGEMNSQLTLPDEAPVSKQMSKLVSDKQEVRKELEISDLNKQEATSMFHARYLPIPKMLKAVAVMAVLVLAQVACTFTQGQDQIAKFQLQSKGKALGNQTFIPDVEAIDPRLSLNDAVIPRMYETDELGYVMLPIRNVSESVTGILDNEDAAKAHLIDMTTTKQLGEVQQGSAEHSELLASLGAELGDLTNREIERQQQLLREGKAPMTARAKAELEAIESMVESIEVVCPTCHVSNSAAISHAERVCMVGDNASKGSCACDDAKKHPKSEVSGESEVPAHPPTIEERLDALKRTTTTDRSSARLSSSTGLHCNSKREPGVNGGAEYPIFHQNTGGFIKEQARYPKTGPHQPTLRQRIEALKQAEGMTVSSNIATQGHRNSSRKPSDPDEHAFGAFPSSSRFEAEQENSITGLKKWDMGLRRMTSFRRDVEYQNSDGRAAQPLVRSA